MCCYFVFCNYDDIKVRYGLNKSYRGLSELRLENVLSIHRQPRPHLTLNVYVSKRNLLIQSITNEMIVLDEKLKVGKRRLSINDIPTPNSPSWF